jgi:hypothetical protein
MLYNVDDLLTVDDVLADALLECGDEGYRKRTKGWYIATVKHALQELEFDVKFNTQFHDEVIPSNLRVPTPEGAFNMIGVWGYSGGQFAETSARRIYRKMEMLTNGGGDGYAANNVMGMVDEQVGNQPTGSVKYFYGVQNGAIILSPECAIFTKVRMAYKGFTKSVMNVAIIPPMLREAIVGYVVVKFFSSMLDENPRQYSATYDRKKNDLYVPNSRLSLSVWDNAKRRVARISPDELRTVRLYWGNPPM